MKSILVAVALLACAVSAEAQQARKIPRIAFLSQGEIAPPLIEAFLDGLRELGYVEKRTIIIEYGDAKGNPDRLPSLAADLVAEKVDVIVVVGGEATLAAKNATRAIPIVMTVASDPVGSGFVASLARPGGNITGLSAFGPETSGKRLELLKEVVPGFSRLAALAYVKNPAFPSQIREVQDAAKALKVQLQLLEVREAKEFVSAFGAAKKGRALGISTITSAFLSAHRKDLVEVARSSKMPVVYHNDSFVDIGGLMSYGPKIEDNYRRAAVLVDKILRGTNPADLPVEQPMKFDFVVNLQAAKQIGLTIPPNVLVRATKVIR